MLINTKMPIESRIWHFQMMICLTSTFFINLIYFSYNKHSNVLTNITQDYFHSSISCCKNVTVGQYSHRLLLIKPKIHNAFVIVILMKTYTSLIYIQRIKMKLFTCFRNYSDHLYFVK